MIDVYDVSENNDDGTSSFPLATFQNEEDAEALMIERNKAFRRVTRRTVWESYAEYRSERDASLVRKLLATMTPEEESAIRNHYAGMQP